MALMTSVLLPFQGNPGLRDGGKKWHAINQQCGVAAGQVVQRNETGVADRAFDLDGNAGPLVERLVDIACAGFGEFFDRTAFDRGHLIAQERAFGAAFALVADDNFAEDFFCSGIFSSLAGICQCKAQQEK